MAKNKLQPKSVVQLVGVVQKDAKGRPTVLLVPGSQGKRYQVILRRVSVDLMTCECRLEAGKIGHIGCLGNSHRGQNRRDVLCKHSQWAVQFAIEEAGMEQAWCEEYEDALKLNQIKKGKIIEVASRQGHGRMWVVVNKKAEQLKLV